MNKEIKTTLLVFALVFVMMVIMAIGCYPFYGAYKTEKELTEIIGDDNFEVEWKVDQMNNNSALLHLAIELPEEFANSSENIFRAEIGSVKNYFGHGDLCSGTKGDLLFVRNESKLENHLLVPNGEKLLIKIEIQAAIQYTEKYVILEKKIIEVIT